MKRRINMVGRVIFVGLMFMSTLLGKALDTEEYDKKMQIALEKITHQQVNKIAHTANNTNSKNEKNIRGYVLSTHIATFSDISKNVDAEIKQYKQEIRLLIRHIALDIELHHGNSGSLILDKNGNVHYVPKKNIPQALNDKRRMLLESNLQNSVSIKSASLAFELLANINRQIKKQALAAQTKQEKEKLYMKQAIFVYEMSDIVIELLDKLTLSGKENLEKLYAETQQKVSHRIKEIEEQKRETKALVTNGDLPKTQLEPSLKSLDAMMQAQNTMLKSWETMMKKVGDQEKYLAKMKSKNKLLKYYKKGARLQIETLRDLRTLSGIQDSISSLDALIDSVSALDLLVLDEKTVSQLLGIDFK